ncbi:tRNA (N6-isopentenyl adenosine(37)-C2)-methylthiotransferase MiaB [Pseudemcibacter aquimaris]|uniref:tRNA (N6-isopentenyl adenosine(37)-C2)-methylthiotransferase MiaB n=1 Tax=Pseudemcibacter aquimaris TaxID=2857064 RepID=UPI00201202BC|nr:tRNA (N6-isopentenyl adenosine(37)-C2)-methylthiotransferase MiaB [Pseudemcibacter aquimaris]MCC3862351.1 tRNA (N6-isopentenyl adenosine(37)-C2)-methylthiotransferase MiaB [Pseudemcibacter aquimaris]WDU59218.1 tRNA (N6-isopentenyl adenosine(37)-C2)-methylthiotransferase MiaB [Pseudemcibacter aquimaris]
MKKKLYIKTYGCQMNVYDTERMVDVMAPEGYEETETPDDADLVVLNTCHIREKAAEKVYSDIGRIRKMKDAKKEKGDEMVLAVGGCVAQAEGAEIMKRAPIVDMVFGPQTYHNLPDMVNKSLELKSEGQKSRILDTDLAVDEKFDQLSKKEVKQKPTAFLTIQEGCDKFCTFCVVPYTRGSEFSRSIDDIMTDAKKLADAGVVEVTLLGQNVNAFHGTADDGSEWGLPQLIRELAKIDGFERIRYTTSHPHDMTDELLEVHGDLEECMPYLHLPVQAGSDRILKAMNRTHDSASYKKIIADLRKQRPDIALSGDFIVGFPGETEEDFEATMDLVREVKYAQAYSFKYSPRPGTPAAEMEDQVDEDVKSARLARLQALLKEQQTEFNNSVIGKTFPVLIEAKGKTEDTVFGRSPYMQAVQVKVGADKIEELLGKIVEVKIEDANAFNIQGVLV